MSHEMVIGKDMQYGKTMAWHNLTVLAAKIEKTLFPPTVLRRLMAQPTRAEITAWVKGGNVDPDSLLTFLETRHSGYSIPFQGNEQIGIPINPETYTVRDIGNLFDSVSNAMGDMPHEIVSAGTLFNRTKYFISVELPNLKPLNIGGREVKLYLTATGALDKTEPERWYLSATVVVCHNTFMASLYEAMANPAGVETKKKGKRGSNEVSTDLNVKGARMFASMRHSKNMADKIAAAETLINAAIGSGKLLESQLKSLLAKDCSITEAKAIYTGFLSGAHKQTVDEFNRLAESADGLELSTRRKNEIAEVTNLFNRGLGNAGETQWDLYNGLTQHYSRREDLASDPDACAKFVQSATAGVYMDRKNEFFDVLMDRPLTETVYNRGKVILDRNGNGEVGDILSNLLAKDTGSKIRSIGHVS